MSCKLNRLIKTYAFLTDCLNTDHYRMSPAFAKDVERRICETLRAIVSLEPSDAGEAVAQTRVVIGELSRTDSDRELADYLKSVCGDHLARFEVQVAVPAPASLSSLVPNDWSCFDLMTERVGVLDRQYRYLFTNKANADFHRVDAGVFLGVPNYAVVGDDYFRIHKSRFDACLAGQRLTTYSGHPLADQERVFSNTLAPAYDTEGRVVAAIVTSREVPRASVPPGLILPTPTE